MWNNFLKGFIDGISVFPKIMSAGIELWGFLCGFLLPVVIISWILTIAIAKYIKEDSDDISQL